MAEEAELPTGRAPMRELCQYQTDIEVVDAKLVGNKGVFKGNVLLKLLYLTEEEELAAWSCQLPFSQYVDLEREYGEEELQTQVVLTDLSVEDANGQGKRLLVNLQLLAQCTVIGKTCLDVIEDAYSLRHAFVPQWQELEAGGRLDRQQISQVVRTQVQAPVKSVLDTRVYLGDPTARREGEAVVVSLPATANVLYLDENDELQGTVVRMEAQCSTELADPCTCRPTAALSGEAFAVPSGDGMEVRCTVEFTLDTCAQQSFRALCGGQLSDEPLPTADEPSVILRTVGEEDTLWSLAKRCRTTTDAICMANGLSGDSQELSGDAADPYSEMTPSAPPGTRRRRWSLTTEAEHRKMTPENFCIPKKWRLPCAEYPQLLPASERKCSPRWHVLPTKAETTPEWKSCRISSHRAKLPPTGNPFSWSAPSPASGSAWPWACRCGPSRSTACSPTAWRRAPSPRSIMTRR